MRCGCYLLVVELHIQGVVEVHRGLPEDAPQRQEDGVVVQQEVKGVLCHVEGSQHTT